jgi:hypothetical protein
MLFAFLGIYEPRDLYRSVYCIDPRRPDKFQYGGIPRRRHLAAFSPPGKSLNLTDHKLMSHKPDLGPNAEIESSGRAANTGSLKF